MPREPVRVDLALQGGGSHGAFTWGVLDRLLEEDWLSIIGVTGTSAGAMNAAVMADGYAAGGAEGARAALDAYWDRVATAARFSPFQRSPLDILLGRWTLDHSPMFVAMDMMSRLFSPYDLNPAATNPLRSVIEAAIDFERLRNSPIKTFVTATNVRTGRGRVFRNADITPDVLLASTAREFDPAEIGKGHLSADGPPILLAGLPLLLVIVVNLLMSFVVLPGLDFGFLTEERWGSTSFAAVSGVWSVAVALIVAILATIVINWRRLPKLRETLDAGANASVLPIFSVASLVGFGAVVAALPAFELVRDWVLSIGGGPLVSLAVATNVLAALTGSASGGLTIALDALGQTYMARASELGIEPALLHRVAVMSAGTLDSLPHSGAVVTLLAVCGVTARGSYRDIVMVAIVGALLALVAVILLGSIFGSF